MATPQKVAGGWRIQLKIGGKRASATFPTQREANAWAAQKSIELRANRKGKMGDIRNLADAMRRYADEVSPSNKGDRWEKVRINAMLEHPDFPVTIPLNDLKGSDFVAWKESRLSTIKASSFNRELSLLGSVFAACIKDWYWCTDNPLDMLRRPPNPPHRERVITPSEIRIMLRTLRHRTGRRPDSLMAVTALAFLLALRTGMRAGEIVGLTWDRVHESWVHLPDTKNGTARNVPIPASARRIFEQARGLDPERVFPITRQTRDAIYRKAREKAGLHGFTFHDSRHTAATRIGATVGQPGRITFPEFCHVFGWKDPRNALVYVNPSAASLAAKM